MPWLDTGSPGGGSGISMFDVSQVFLMRSQGLRTPFIAKPRMDGTLPHIETSSVTSGLCTLEKMPDNVRSLCNVVLLGKQIYPLNGGWPGLILICLSEDTQADRGVEGTQKYDGWQRTDCPD